MILNSVASFAGEILDQPFTLDKVHRTLDFAQTVGLPQHARQMGPLFFLSLWKVHLFGVITEGLPVQYKYLIDEAQTIDTDGTYAHGPNSVISVLDHCLSGNGFQEDRAVYGTEQEQLCSCIRCLAFVE